MFVTRRDPIKTRRTVLDAAARAVVAHGAGVSLDVIAREAGVSKSGLLHHFPSREHLLVAAAEDMVQQFRDAVTAAADPGDHGRGRLVRAYVNASFDSIEDEPQVPDYVLLGAALATVPGVRELLRADKEHWDAAFAADGLDPQRALLITRAADGAGFAGLWEGGIDRAQLQHTRDLLLALTRGDGPLVSPVE